MRGIGERSQFAGEGPPNFSVGFIVDDIDFSGIGAHASMFDVQNVEILRGPQAAIYGSRALAGLINIQTREPTPHVERRVELTAGSDDLYAIGVAAGGPVNKDHPDRLAIRASVHKLYMNGYRDNRFLGRDDTNERDELTTRLKLRWQPDDTWRIDLSGLFADFDNGYDQFVPDNNGFDMVSDRPGRDHQESIGGSGRITWLGPETFRVIGISSYVFSDIEYSYDADWGNDAFWAAAPYFWDPAVMGFPYDFTETLLRERDSFSQDIRIISKPGGEIFGGSSAWNFGVYGNALSEDDDYEGFGILDSQYEAASAAIYGQVSTRITPAVVLHTSLRIEERQTDYEDDRGLDFDDDETMWGGRLALETKISEDSLLFASASRGFKGGGVNQDPALPDALRPYDSETLWNFEVGAGGSLNDGKTQGRLTLFYMHRDDLQITTSIQSDPTDPTAFAFFTGNAAEGRNVGIEAELVQVLTETVELYGNLSLLDTEFKNFRSAGGVNDIEGRDQPYAPNYAIVAGGRYSHPDGFFAKAEVEGRDAYYFSDSHDQRSDPYELLHLKLGYTKDNWTLTLWGRNVLDKKYAVRGFFFGLEPPAFEETLYLAHGDPAQFGATLEMLF
jgi:outer membrane receptor protein involved in Fe transport